MVREFVRAPVRAVPSRMARRLGPCRIIFRPSLGSRRMASRWVESRAEVAIELAAADREPHDLGMELLLCLGQVLWERITALERRDFLDLLRREMDAGIPGDIDEDVLAQKRSLLAVPGNAASVWLVERYCRAAFAATASEFLHALWHDVHVRSGPEHLPAEWLRRRLQLLARWFPPDRGRRLLPPAES